MPAARILAIIVLSASSAFAQQQRFTSNRAPGNVVESSNYFASPPEATPTEPWRIIPDQSKEANPTKPSQDHLSNGEADKRALEAWTHLLEKQPVDLNSQHPWIRVFPEGKALAGMDETCLTIRSYVVARDSKDSDATHPVSESTCQPSSRYSLRTTDLVRPASQDH